MDSNTGTGTKANEFRPGDYINITILGFGLSALWASLHMIILQVRLLDFVPEALKETRLGYLTFAGGIIAMVTQPIAGALSDRSGFAWGRRRPFILIGIVLALLFLPGIGLFDSYAAIFIIYCLMQIGTNTAQSPFQGLIPDLVPDEKRGLASGVRGLLNIVGGATLLWVTGRFMGHYSAGEGSSWLWLTLITLAIVLLGTMLATVLTVKERPGTSQAQLPLLSTLYRSFKINIKERPDFILFLVSSLLIFTAWAILQRFALYFLGDVIGIANPATVTADLNIVVAGFMLVTVYFSGRLSDRIGRRRVIVPAGLLSALGVVALYFSQSYTHIMFSGALLGISSGGWMSSQWALATDLVGKGEEAKYLGIVNLVIAGGAALAGLIGPVIGFFNAYSPNMGYQVMLLVCFIFFIIGSLLLMKIRMQGLAEEAMPQ